MWRLCIPGKRIWKTKVLQTTFNDVWFCLICIFGPFVQVLLKFKNSNGINNWEPVKIWFSLYASDNKLAPIDLKLDWGLLKWLKFLSWVFRLDQFCNSLEIAFYIQWKADLPLKPTKSVSPNCSWTFLNGMSATSMISIDPVFSHSKIKHFPFSCFPSSWRQNPQRRSWSSLFIKILVLPATTKPRGSECF